MFLFRLLLLATIWHLSFASQLRGLHGSGPRVVKHGMFSKGPLEQSRRNARRASVERRQAANPTGCSSGGQIIATAPKSNIFAGLTNDEAAAVTSFLHDQKSLNLTAAANATRWDSPSIIPSQD